ncbi:MAG: hypothetical protein N2036_15140 [Bryobacteraceae bacterium]|nr:hypothetical protein [Bryobacteraceae bacterium]
MAEVHIVPNTHGTVAGWLVDFDTERNYVLNNYLEHARLAARWPGYRFVWSEAPNLISLLELEPAREAELRRLLAAGQAELVNAFFLEADMTLPGGETLAQLGVQGIRWQEEVFGVRPRYAWAIDITGAHRQLPQIARRLGLDAVVFTRNNPAGRTAFWWRAPDGTRALAATAPHYMELRELFQATDPADGKALEAMERAVRERLAYSPSPRLALFLGGASDYSLPPALGERTGELLGAWQARHPDVRLRWSTFSEYLQALRAERKRGVFLPEYAGDVAFCFNGFWANLPEVKRAFRRTEHLLRAAELAASAASLQGRGSYPARRLREAWLLLLVNADRNAIWGAGAGEAFRSGAHWDVWDRFEGAQQRLEDVLREALAGGRRVLLNPLNWERRDPFALALRDSPAPAGAVCIADPREPGEARCQVRLPPAQAVAVDGAEGRIERPVPADVPREIVTRSYRARIDEKTGELAELATAAGRPLLAGGAGSVRLEEPPEPIAKTAADFLAPRRQRRRLPPCRDAARVQAWRAEGATVVASRAECRDHSVERRIWFYRNFPRIDFEIVLELRRSDALATADFPFAGRVERRTRGIPFGFSEGPADEKWLEPAPYFLARAAEHHLFGYSAAVMPALGWSDYRLAGGGGLALLDEGLPMHEFAEDRLTLGLVNAVSQYRGLPNEELRGLGTHRFRFALLPHEGDWRDAEAPRRAREFSSPPVLAGRGAPLAEIVRTSDNLMLEAVRRDGRDLEVRLTEWRGEPGMAWVECLAPHRAARRANLLGEEPQPLGRRQRYRFAVMPQEIVTLRFELAAAVEHVPALRTWEPLVPEAKRAGLKMRIREKGHPPRPF